MIALLQRVNSAAVTVHEECIARIGAGLLVFIAVERGDGEMQAERLIERVLDYRIFSDSEGRMNRSLRDIDGDLLLVSQFTLAADTRKGTRPSFTPAAAPEDARRLFDCCVSRAARSPLRVEQGRFGADMKVSLINDGPVTLWLRVASGDDDV
ncbi:MAG: D-tyrosyl-tRNA(Tyr) deacylase [Chromatiales bacterium]|jgi:D-tyrosyl-tRNA(Tyr) deacylase|nr:D-tyrosyl-tRNA(Tyr) deacylase [Chromatiales bacterium]